MGRLVAIVLVVAAAGIAVVAVNGPGRDKPEVHHPGAAAPGSSHVVPGAPGAQTAADLRAPVAATVVMHNLSFAPARVSVRVGQAVRFVNHDDVAHTVFQDTGARSGEVPLVDSPRILPGQSFTFVPHAAGTIAYICTLHPAVMTGRIVVTPRA